MTIDIILSAIGLLLLAFFGNLIYRNIVKAKAEKTTLTNEPEPQKERLSSVERKNFSNSMFPNLFIVRPANMLYEQYKKERKLVNERLNNYLGRGNAHFPGRQKIKYGNHTWVIA